MNNHKQGILFIIMAGFFFALMTFFVRLSGDLPTMEKAFFRNAVAAGIAFVTLLQSGETYKPTRDTVPDLFWRSLCGTIGLICNFYAIDKLNIADANILNKLSPFFAILMSAILLKEKANKTEWFCVLLAFTGALFVIKPSFQMQSVYAFIGMLGGLGAGAAYTFVRRLGKKGVPSPVIVLCFSVFSCLVCLPSLIFHFVPMSGKQLLFLLLAGISAAGGQFSITKAYTKAPAKEISVFDYTQVLFAAMLGFLFLGQVPDGLSLIGYVIIIGSAVYKWARIPCERMGKEKMINNDLLLVIDMQNVYTKGQKWACLDTEGAAKRTLSVIGAMEQAGNHKIMFTRFLADEHPEGVWKQYNQENAEVNASVWDNEMLPELTDALRKYPLYTKSVYSSLAIPEVLEAVKKADRVVITGVVAECCVLSTVFALIDAGIYVVYLTDGVSGLDREKEDATELVLSGLAPLHLSMMTVEEYLQTAPM